MWTFLGLVIIICYLFYRWRKRTFNVFETMGLPGPKPHLLWGNYFDFKLRHVKVMDGWIEKYGTTFGAFWGDLPIVVTKDLELIEKIFIKQFSTSTNRAKQFPLETSHPVLGSHLAIIRGPKWKRLRSLISPSFTARKMKQMLPLWIKGMDHMIEAFEKDEQCKQGTNMYPYFKRLTLDNIGRTAFGIDTNSHDRDAKMDPILEAANKVVDIQINGIADILISSFSSFAKVLTAFIKFLFRMGMISHASDDISKYCQAIVQKRRADNSGVVRVDLLQSLIEADESQATSILAMTDDNSESNPVEKNISNMGKGIHLTHEEIVGNTFLFVLAGYETTSTALGFIIKHLAGHPDVQSKLRSEIKNKVDVTNIDYYKLVNMPYMDAVIHESLRYTPSVTGFVTREISTEMTHEGIKYPAGMCFFVPVFQVHRDEANFQNANTFNPDRFLPENKHQIHPVAYLGFGAGPRNCIGMRLALTQLKLALAIILSKYEVVTHEENHNLSEKSVLLQPETVSIKLNPIK